MADYDKFAQFYDGIMGRPIQRIEFVKRLIREHHPSAKTLLELGCGTGSVMLGLSDDYRVSGLDRSAKMLQIARQKVSAAQFYLGDMAEFDLGEKFDVIICVFDSINHLTDFEQWQSLFRRSRRHLNDGGYLIFDMDTIKRLRSVTLTPFEEAFDGGRAKVKVIANDAQFVWQWDFYKELGEGKFKSYSEEIVEVAFGIGKVKDELAKNFVVKTICDSSHNPATENSARVYFVGQKLP